ncbi:hypothetical protein JTE90_010732 [Oedothorax gibbosus]|uniref:Uncharacterized protein n=1 Tax=Oedothorax gibbosus TaxID=931172 RepID=A0AAV6UQD7_9ARAC|nr:hypothetical protein JTE90_010732 [Oedothorax gibbosus]
MAGSNARRVNKNTRKLKKFKTFKQKFYNSFAFTLIPPIRHNLNISAPGTWTKKTTTLNHSTQSIKQSNRAHPPIVESNIVEKQPRLLSIHQHV